MIGIGIGLNNRRVRGFFPPFTEFALRPSGPNLINSVLSGFSSLTFSRASAGELIMGGSRMSFASGAARIHQGVITLDDGVTNGLAQPEDISNAAWTKSNVTVGAATNLGGGTVPFWPVMETAATGIHSVRADVVSNATDWLTIAYVAPTLGRTRCRFDITGAQTGSGIRVLFDLTGAGAVTSALTVGGSPGTVLGSGIEALANGVYMCWSICRTANQTHTSARALVSVDDGTSYAGDIAKGLLVGPVMMANVSTFRSYAAATRAAETLTAPLASGTYDFRVRNNFAEEWRAMVTVSAGTYTITPPAGYATLTKVEGYKLDFVKDWSGDANTLDGDIPGFVALGAYAGSYPLPAATKGRISGGKVLADQGDVLYIVKDLSEPVHFMEVVASWTDTGGAGNEGIGAMFASPDPNVISNMPHHTWDRDKFMVGKRIAGGALPVLATYNFAPNPAENGSQFQLRHSTTTTGTVSLAVRNSERMSPDYQDADLADAGAVGVGTRCVWEIFQPAADAGATMALHKVAARYRPIILAD